LIAPCTGTNANKRRRGRKRTQKRPPFPALLYFSLLLHWLSVVFSFPLPESLKQAGWYPGLYVWEKGDLSGFFTDLF